MSFGFSVGDFLTVGELAWKVYKSCREAPESFGNLSQEVLSLQALLKEVEEAYSQQTLSRGQTERLAAVRDGCRSVLEDLQGVINEYESLGTQSKRTWDRMRWGDEQIAELRARLTSNIAMLTAFISTSQYTVQTQLNKYLRDHQLHGGQGSVITTQTIESISADEKEAWRAIRKEMQDIGITIAAFEANKQFIFSWFRDALSSGAFEEDGIDDIASTFAAEDSRKDENYKPQSSSRETTDTAESSTPRRRSRNRDRLLPFMSSWFGSGAKLDISEPKNPVHITHVGLDNTVGAFTGLPKEWTDVVGPAPHVDPYRGWKRTDPPDIMKFYHS